MKYLVIVILIFETLLLSSCVSLSDLDESLSKLDKNAQTKKNFTNPRQAAQTLHKECVKRPINKKHPNRTGLWNIEISHNDNIINQGNTKGYFKVLCLDLKNRANKLSVTGIHAGGGMGKAFFLLPKVTIFDAQWNRVQHILKNVKQNAATGNLEMYLDIKNLSPSRYYVVFEGDNRAEKNEIGDYMQTAYSTVPIISNVKMYSLPVGKARLNIEF